MDLQTVEVQINEAKQAMVLERKRHEKTMKEFQEQLNKAEREKALLLEGIDFQRVQRAEKIISFELQGNYFDRSVLFDAIDDIAEGTRKMERSYFGSKNYDQWRNQRSDHTYGYGPSHGTIVCSVGLKRPFRTGLENAEKEDVLYYLNLLLDNEKREKILALKTA